MRPCLLARTTLCLSASETADAAPLTRDGLCTRWVKTIHGACACCCVHALHARLCVCAFVRMRMGAYAHKSAWLAHTACGRMACTACPFTRTSLHQATAMDSDDTLLEARSLNPWREKVSSLQISLGLQVQHALDSTMVASTAQLQRAGENHQSTRSAPPQVAPEAAQANDASTSTLEQHINDLTL